MSNSYLSAIADVERGRYAVDEHRLAKRPTIGNLGIHQAGKHEFPFSLDDLRVRGVRYLAFARHGRNLVSLDNNHRILNRRASIAIDQRSAFNNDWRLRRSTLGQ